MSILISILVVFHIIICLLMVLLVLMQRPRSEGLGAAFGGGMADNLFGAQTTHVLQKLTVWLGGGFFALTLLLSMLYTRATVGQTTIQKELLSDTPTQSAPAVPATTPATPVTPTKSTTTPSPTPTLQQPPVPPAPPVVEKTPSVEAITTTPVLEVKETVVAPAPAASPTAAP